MATTLFLLVLFFFTVPFCMAQYSSNILYSGDYLYSGQSLTYGSYSFIMQNDCNLVLYDSGRPIWASNTGGLAYGCAATLQTDGNLVVYSNGRPIWASNTGGGQSYFVLILQRDRNVVIYGPPTWATGTNRYGNGVITIANNNNTAAAFPVVVNSIKASDDGNISMVTGN